MTGAGRAGTARPAEMLGGMDVPPAAAWLLLGAVLGILLTGAVVSWVASARSRGSRAGVPEAVQVAPVDDLADFLEHPPGTRPATPRTGWTVLGPTSSPSAAPEAGDVRGRPGTARTCVAALALVGSVAAVTATAEPQADPARGSSSTHSEPAPDDGPDDSASTDGAGTDDGAVAAVMTFSGLVLEPRAVGITAAYPEVRLTADGDAPRLDVLLPTYNCLTRTAPADPLAAGCAAALVEQGTVGPDDLRLDRDGDRWVATGRLATLLPAGGSPPEPTGRVYDLELTVSPGDGPAAEGWRSAAGRLRLGTATATADEAGSRLRVPG